MHRVARTLLVVLMGAMGSLVACGDDEPDDRAPGGGSSGELNEGGSAVGEGGTGRSSAGDASRGGMLGGDGGIDNSGGASDVGGSGASGEASATGGGGASGASGASSGEAGAGGALPVAPPDLIIRTGGPWPDSFTGRCSTPSNVVPCPRSDEPFFGQDGTYRINVPTYSSTASTMTDSVTGLVWQLEPEALTKTQADAGAYCDALTLDGHEDWRLPTRLEYVTMLDEGLPGGFAVPTKIPSETTGTHWTDSASGASVTTFFVVQDDFGKLNVASSDTKLKARCVRGPALSGVLTVGTDTVVDSMTQLEWQRSSLDESARSWAEALEHCETLTHATKDDWRLPSIKELVTIVDEAATAAPVLDEASFGDGSAPRYWSATPALSFSDERVAFTLDTSFGATPDVKMIDVAAARCVRTAGI